MSVFPDFLDESSLQVAKKLLGCIIEREINGQSVSGRIVETEAYDQSDAASHSYRGETARSAVMFGESGHAYIYFTYGMHYCFNVSTGPIGHGAGVLIRALEPISGLEVMSANRIGKVDHDLTNGPAKLCQALGIDKMLGGHDLRKRPFRLRAGELAGAESIIQTTRIGISQAVDEPWRFYIEGNPYVSKAINRQSRPK